MESLLSYMAPPSQCGYLPDQVWRLQYEYVSAITAAEYQVRMESGWRRFGHVLFRPRCEQCSACQSIRVRVDHFRPNRSQRRAWTANHEAMELRIGKPRVTKAKLELYDRYHAFQSETKGWPTHPAKDADEYADSFANNPFPTQEWCYYEGGRLVGVGYVDDLPTSLSAIYFFHDPKLRQRSLGTWNVMRVIAQAARHGLPHVYLGYYVDGCGSLTYKANFEPNEVRTPDGAWRPFRG